jgi:hypothetical protein
MEINENQWKLMNFDDFKNVIYFTNTFIPSIQTRLVRVSDPHGLSGGPRATLHNMYINIWSLIFSIFGDLKSSTLQICQYIHRVRP